MTGFTTPTITIAMGKRSSLSLPASSDDDDNYYNWGIDDNDDNDEPDNKENDARLNAMRSVLQSSWDTKSMGIIPTDPQSAAMAAGQSVANALSRDKNVILIDLKLPSYDITEGSKVYDSMAVYDFCSFLSDNLRERKLLRKSLILVRNEKERAEVDRVRSRRGDVTKTTTATTTTISESYGASIEDDDDERGEDQSEGGDSSEVDEFRRKLVSSWDSDDLTTSTTSSIQEKVPQTAVDDSSSSHRVWSMVGDSDDISNGVDMFETVIAKTDQNAILQADEDALIIISPYDTTDVIALRRIMARYGQRTIIIVNSRIETTPRELHSAVLAYAVMPLVARSKQGSNEESGLKAVVMKRFPADWTVYIDVYGDGFVEARGGDMQQILSEREFPSPEWITQRVEAHVRGLPNE